MPDFARSTLPRRSLGVAVAAAALFAGAGPVRADVITQTITLSQQTLTLASSVGNNGTGTTYQYGAFSFNGFDTSLGTLTGVSEIRTGTITLNGTLTNTLQNSETFTYFDEGTYAIINPPSATISSSRQLVQPYPGGTSMTLASGQTATLASVNYTPASSTFNVPVGNIGNFEAGPLDFTITAQLLSSVQANSAFLDGISQNLTETTAGTYELDYTYTPNAVPEPASLAILGGGIVLTAASMTRRRTRSGIRP